MFEGDAKIIVGSGFGGQAGGGKGVPALAENKKEPPKVQAQASDAEPCEESSIGADWKLELVGKVEANAVFAGASSEIPIGEVTKDGARFTFDLSKIKGEVHSGGGFGLKIGVEGSADVKIHIRVP